MKLFSLLLAAIVLSGCSSRQNIPVDLVMTEPEDVCAKSSAKLVYEGGAIPTAQDREQFIIIHEQCKRFPDNPCPKQINISNDEHGQHSYRVICGAAPND